MALFLSGGYVFSSGYPLYSPNRKLEVMVQVGEKVDYAITCDGKPLILASPVSLRLSEGLILGKNETVRDFKTISVTQTLYPVVAVKNKEVPDEYNELTINFKNSFSIVFRAYDDGIAYRFVTRFNKQILVKDEEAVFNFAGDEALLFPENMDFRTDAAKPYLKERLSAISFNRFSVLPALVDFENGIKMVITEADLSDYPGMYLRGNSNHSFYGKFPPARAKQTQYMDKPGWDRHVHITETEPYIAKTVGSRNFPWRVMIISMKDGDLVASEMVYKLSQKNKIADVSWIKPGKAAWDWWNDNNVTGVDFKAGMNTATYKYYIDFAAKQHLAYIVIDEGWYVLGNLFNVVPEMNMKEIISYANQKGIGVFLWVVWKTLDDQLPAVMDLFQRWGVKGLKVDFMELDDQMMINNYYRVAREAADRKLMVEFHGSSKPDGISGPYPNVLTRDLAPGLEFNKWDGKQANPEMAVTLPFIRMVAGPMDYTPGAMINATQDDYAARFKNPMSLGTRCQQMAMFVVYESPLTVMADNASRYYKEQECTDFITEVPTVWDKTLILTAKVGDYIIIARKKGKDWFVGAMTNWDGRTLTIPLSFLDDKDFRLEFFRDGVNADRNAMDYKKETRTVSNKDSLQIVMAPGGGWAGKISPVY
ncbi:MAG: glycoside hydrolase family 97 protein [Chitinophagales bacterium]